MSRYIYYSIRSIAFVLLLISFGSCSKDFLEVVPKGKLIAEKTKDYNLMLNTVNWISSTIELYQGDDVAAIEPFFSSVVLPRQRAFKYEADIYQDEETVSDVVSTAYSNLYLLNKIINEVPESREGTQAEKDAVEAEAKAFRAWEYMMLINKFAKPYNAATAATDPGFPIITTSSVTETFSEKPSVQQVYDFIIKDLTEAIPHLSDRILHAQRISKPAAQALLGKVYWFMGKYSEALPLFDNAINGIGNTNILLQFNNFNVTTLAGGLQNPTANGPRGLVYPNGDPESMWVKTLLTTDITGTGTNIVISPKASALYGPTDIRLTKFLRNSPLSSTTPFPVPGMYQKLGYTRSATGATLPDIYLMRAECRARNNNLTGAREDLKELRKNRMPLADAEVSAALSKDDLIRFVIEERMREYAGLGHRWYDMRRLSADPLFTGTIGYVHTLYAADGSVKETYTLTPERFYWRIPKVILRQNPGLESNP